MPSGSRLPKSPPLSLSGIGKTGLRVTRLGLGGAPLGGLFESVREEEARATLSTAYAAGIRYFDTAPFYGHGRGEMRVGAFLSGRPRDEFVLSTKVGRVLVPAEGRVEDQHYKDVLPLNPVFDFSADGIRRSFDSSLERLGLERVDILLVHDPDAHYRAVMDEAFPALARLRDDGVIRAIGAGMNQWEMLRDFARDADFDCFLLAGRYTLLDQSALPELLPLCEKRRVAILLGGPYNSGVLAGGGHYNYERPAPAILEKVRRLERVAARHEVPLKAAALQFPLAHPSVASVIPGARTAAEVEENVRMFSCAIPSDFWNELRVEKLLLDEAPVPE
jgi:D-threo-aldose 1-dehydrogenase